MLLNYIGINVDDTLSTPNLSFFLLLCTHALVTALVKSMTKQYKVSDFSMD